ncbi:hypothetical protein V0288_24680 [Pannus brasiliensis CCIBt3594]|uniref:Uncharacterized protein n=1 Tax=Pannus brasiliensis CCIBt3594 TaxID=1427578 RepID=A0AAW9R1H3_9CHRO
MSTNTESSHSCGKSILYPPVEQQELATLIPNLELFWLRSPHDHDAFLREMEALNALLVAFRETLGIGNRNGRKFSMN